MKFCFLNGKSYYLRLNQHILQLTSKSIFTKSGLSIYSSEDFCKEKIFNFSHYKQLFFHEFFKSKLEKINKLTKKCKFFLQSTFLLASKKLNFSRTAKEEKELVKMAQEDPEKFSEIYEIYFEKMYKFFFFRLRDQDDAEDLTSETFEKVFKKLSTFTDQGLPFGAWIFKIARNNLIDHLRKKKIKITSIDELLPSEEPGNDFDLHSLEQGLIKEQVWEVIKKLPQKQQEIWSLKLANDLSSKQIAGILGISESNVNVIVHRSLGNIKKMLSHLKN